MAFRLPSFHTNLRKRLIKMPKLHFHDTGLVCWLLGIREPGQLRTHPLRGALFENLVIAEALKHRLNRGRQPNLSFFRDARGLECDLLYETGQSLGAVEIKSGSTVPSDAFNSLNRVADLLPAVSVKAVVTGGADRQSRRDGEVVPLADLPDLLKRFDHDPMAA